MGKFHEASYKFSIRFFQKQVQEAGMTNSIAFPGGAQLTLASLLLGSSGETANELRKALHLWREAVSGTPADEPSSGTDCDKPGGFHSEFKQVLSVLRQYSKHHALKIASRLYIYYDVMEHFKHCIKELYNSEVEKVDLMNATEDVRQKINSWVERQTDGVITNFFPVNSIDRSTSIILLNTTFFYGRWLLPFNPKETHRGVFWTCKDKSIYVDMMTRKGRFNVANISNPSMQVVQIPFANEVLSMYIFMPDNQTADEIIQNLNYEQLRLWIRPDIMRSVETRIFMPKFSMEANYSLNNVFRSMGVNSLFTPGKADLSSMTGDTEAVVSNISQSVVFAIGEDGAEAAGTSRTEVSDGSHPDIKVNRDFWFIVIHKGTGFIVFMGRICDPKWKWNPK